MIDVHSAALRSGLLAAAAVVALAFPASVAAQDAGASDGGQRPENSGDDGGPVIGTAALDGGLRPDADVTDGALTAMAGHIMVVGSPTAVRVSQVYVLVVSPGAEVGPSAADEVWLPLPADAVDLEVERGEELVRPVAGGLALRQELGPGRHPLAFSFTMPAMDSRAAIVHELPFSVRAFHVMWPAGQQFSARAMGFADAGTVQMGPRRMRIMERAGFEAGSRLIVVTSSQAAPPPARATARTSATDPLGFLRQVTLVLAVLLLLAGLLLPFHGRWWRPVG